MTQKTTKALLTIGILILHLLTAWRTGADTYSVTGDLLNVVLMDLTFVIAALAAAYLGGSVESLFIRPVAAVLAWVLYIQMVVIGFEAHTEHPEVALAVRTAGFGLLVLDTWTYLVAAGRKIRSSGTQARDWRGSLRGGVASIAYVLSSILLAPMVAIIMLVRALFDYMLDVTSKPSKQYAIRASDGQAFLRVSAEGARISAGAPLANHKQVQPATYTQAEDGTWSFECPVCGPEHEGARLKAYETEEQAHRGYSAHQAIHNRPSLPPVMVGNDQ